MRSRNSKAYLHATLLIIGLLIPFLFITFSKMIRYGSLTLTILGLIIPLSFLISLLFLFSPLIFLLLMLPFRNRFIDLEEIDLYAGLSSKMLFIVPILTSQAQHFYWRYYFMGYIFYLAPVYGFITPFELIPPILLTMVTGDLSFLGNDPLIIFFSIIFLTIYIYTLYFAQRNYRKLIFKFVYVASMTINIFFLIITLTAPFSGLVIVIQLPLLIADIYRYIKLNTHETTFPLIRE